MSQIKQTCSVTNGSQTVTIAGVDLSHRIRKNHIFMLEGALAPYFVAADAIYDGAATSVTLTGAYAGATDPAARGVFAVDATYPDMIPTIAQGDVGTAAIFTQAMYRLQALIAAVAPEGLARYSEWYAAMRVAQADVVRMKGEVAGNVQVVVDAKDAAETAQADARAHRDDAAGAASIARKWATQDGGEVVAGQGYSARKHAAAAAGSALDAATSERGASASAGGALKSAGDAAAAAAEASAHAAHAKSSETNAATSAGNALDAAGAAQAWATSAGKVDGVGYGARYYASQAAGAADGASAAAAAALESAAEAARREASVTVSEHGAAVSAESASNSAGAARDWAMKTDGEVVPGQGRGAKYYAEQAAAAASQAISGQIQANWSEVDENGKGFILNKPALAPVATSGSKADIGLGNVEDKSSATIRAELTSDNVTRALGYTPVSAAARGGANGIASLGADGKVPAAQLPSFVDDVVEGSNANPFPAMGETSKIYVNLDNNKTYRWGGSAYVEISASPGSSDAVPEGASNRYFSESRVLDTLLSGFSATANAAANAGDSVLSAMGKLQAQIGAAFAAIAAKAPVASPAFTGSTTTAGAVSALSGSGGQVEMGGDANGSIEIGKTGRAAAGTPFIDFHSAQDSGDFDVRVIASGGRAGAVGEGYLNIQASALQVNASKVVTEGSIGGLTAGWATYLQTARKINGVAFNGSADITIADATRLPLAGHVGMLNGGLADLWTGNDLNGLTATGFYRGSSMPNAPDAGWWYVLVESHDNTGGGAPGWTKQTATAYGSGNSYPAGATFVRVRAGTTSWNAWYRLGATTGDATIDFAGRNITASGTVYASGAGGFAASTYAVNVRNPIYRFANADGYGLSYFQGTAGVGGNQDTIGLHFGTPTAAGSQFQFLGDGTSYFGNRITSYAGGFKAMGGGDMVFQPAAGSADAGDIVWVNADGSERHRLYSDPGVNSLYYRYNGGTTYTLLHTGNFIASENADPSTIVRRTTNGYINGNYIWMSDDGNPGGNTNPITAIIAKRGDNYYRGSDALSVRAFLGLRDVANRQIGPGENLNNFYATSGFFGFDGSPVNAPGSDGQLLCLGNANKDTSAQVYFPYASLDMFIRTSSGWGAYWNAWTRVVTEANIGNYAAGKAARVQFAGGDGNGTTFNWSGQGGTPTWLVGGWDSTNLYVFNPANFDVSSALVVRGNAHTNGSDGWWRSNGNCGWYNETYGVGIWASQGGQVRTYNGASFYSEGEITAAGNITAYSDERLKKNWRPVQDDFVGKLARVKAGVYDRTDRAATQAGVSAQSWRELLPETVWEDSEGMLSVNYGAGALVSSVELAKKLVAVERRLEQAMQVIAILEQKVGVQ